MENNMKPVELYRDEIALAAQLLRAGIGRKAPSAPVLLHFSDVHNSERALGRVLEFYDECQLPLTDIIHTGDSVSGRFCQGMSAFRMRGAERILNVVGNHDMLNTAEGWDWSMRASNEALYDMIFRPFCANWGVQMAENTTYWYKDYEEYKFRLIGIDCTLADDGEQLAWLEEVLLGALAAEYSVVIATHFPPSRRETVRCGFSSDVREYNGEGPITTMVPEVQETVSRFMKKGGEFVCYLAGHTHTDYLWYSKDYPDQLCVTVDSANVAQANFWSDTYRVEGTKSEELFNLFSFDTERKLVKLVRIGANVNTTLQSKRMIAINYRTMEVVNRQ